MADTTQDGAAPAETQAPVAGADPRAWREMAERFAVVLRAATAPAEFDAAAFPALTALREAVDECERLAREERVAAGWLATIVIDRLGGTPDVPAWVAQSAENYQRLTRERDEAERMGHDAVEWIGVVRDLLVDAGYQPGDRDVALANLRTLVAAAARGAEGEQLRDMLHHIASATRDLVREDKTRGYDAQRRRQDARTRLVEVAREVLRRFDALAPRPSAGPARCGDCDGCMTGGACTGAARASDDPAPTTPDEDDEPMTFDEVFRGASVVGVRRDAAPAAPEVSRG